MSTPRAGRGNGRCLLLGLSLALFLLWLPLMTPQIMHGWRQPDADWDPSGLLTLLVTTGGFSATLIIDRFVARSLSARWRQLAGVAMMLLTPPVVFLPLPPMAGLAVMFFCATCVAVQTLPAIKALGFEEASSAACAIAGGVVAGGGMAAAGLYILARIGEAWPDFYRLPLVVFACVLPTGGMVLSGCLRRLPEPRSKDGPDLFGAVAPTSGSGRRLPALRCLGFLVCCVSTMLLSSALYSGGADEKGALPVLRPLSLACAGCVLLVPFLWGKRRGVQYFASLGASLGGVMLLAGPHGAVFTGVSYFLLVLGIAGLGLLALENAHCCTAAVNQTFAMGIGSMLLFAFLWLAVGQEQLVWLGGGIPPWLVIASTGVVMSLLHLLWLPSGGGQFPAAAGKGEEENEESVGTVFPVGAEEQLTATEKKVYRLILTGYTNQQMAEALYVSINTIKFHVKNILSKLGASKKSQLMGKLINEVTGLAGAGSGASLKR